jgi:hypothetical protein
MGLVLVILFSKFEKKKRRKVERLEMREMNGSVELNTKHRRVIIY